MFISISIIKLITSDNLILRYYIIIIIILNQFKSVGFSRFNCVIIVSYFLNCLITYLSYSFRKKTFN